MSAHWFFVDLPDDIRERKLPAGAESWGILWVEALSAWATESGHRQKSYANIRLDTGYIDEMFSVKTGKALAKFISKEWGRTNHERQEREASFIQFVWAGVRAKLDGAAAPTEPDAEVIIRPTFTGNREADVERFIQEVVDAYKVNERIDGLCSSLSVAAINSVLCSAMGKLSYEERDRLIGIGSGHNLVTARGVGMMLGRPSYSTPESIDAHGLEREYRKGAVCYAAKDVRALREDLDKRGNDGKPKKPARPTVYDRIRNPEIKSGTGES